MAAVEGKQIWSVVIILIILIETSNGSIFQSGMQVNNVLRFDMNDFNEAQNGESVLNQHSNSRTKRDVSESSECKNQEQKFLQSAAQTEGFLNSVSAPFIVAFTKCDKTCFEGAT